MNKELKVIKKIGRPTKYNNELLEKTKQYYRDCIINNKMPYIEELSIVLDVDDDQIVNYGKRYPIFHAVIKKIKSLQKLNLQKIAVHGQKPVGSIFLLKVNHGFIETEKTMHVGANDETLNIVFTDSKAKEGTEANTGATNVPNQAQDKSKIATA